MAREALANVFSLLKTQASKKISKICPFLEAFLIVKSFFIIRVIRRVVATIYVIKNTIILSACQFW